MFRNAILAVRIVTIGALVQAYGQDAVTRAAALDKNKYKKKDRSKNGINISVEAYIDIKNDRRLIQGDTWTNTADLVLT